MEAKSGRAARRARRSLVVAALLLGALTIPATSNASGAPPTAVNDSYTLVENSSLTQPAPGVLANDTDPESDPLTAAAVTQPSNGSLTLNADGSFNYQPAINFSGTDSFTYVANDGTSNSAPATVTITVTPLNHAPIAHNQSVSTPEGNAKAITLNATDVDNDPLTYTVTSNVTHGALSCSAAGACNYTPTANFVGSDSFTFTANDGQVDSNTATVSITVTSVNQAPVANDVSASTPEATAKSITLSATDPDGDTLTYHAVAQPSHGSVTGCADGTCTYTPDANYVGADSFTYQATDNGTPPLTSNTATVSITVTAVNHPPVATDQTVPLIENIPVTFNLNATDPDGNPLTYAADTLPAAGTVTCSASTGHCTYTPAVNGRASESFTWHANDGSLNSNIATVTFTIVPVNQPPVAKPSTFSTPFNVTLSVPAPGVLASASDPENDPMTASVKAMPSHGTLTLGSNGSFVYDPAPQFKGTDTFSYIATDSHGAKSAAATVTISVDILGGTGPVNFVGTNANEERGFVSSLPRGLHADLRGGSDTYDVFFGALQGLVQIADSGTTGVDHLNTYGTSGGDGIVVDGSHINDGAQHIEYSGIEYLAVNGQGGNDSIVVGPDSFAGLRGITVNGGGGSDSLLIQAGNRPAVVRGNTIIVDGWPPITFSGIDRLTVNSTATPSSFSSDGYWLFASDGGVFTFGNAKFYGSTGGLPLHQPVIQMVRTPTSRGYWLLASDGGVFSFGNAKFYGSTGGLALHAPIIQMIATPTGHGYWLLASDGGVFSFGDAKFYGSTGGLALHAPVVQMVPSLDGHGYWLRASDGGIFSYGDARFYGSTGAQNLGVPIIQMVPSPNGGGYWLLAANGGVFGYGSAAFHGATNTLSLNASTVQLVPTPSGNGYWLLHSDGSVFAFGDAGYYGSMLGHPISAPVVQMVATSSGHGYWLLGRDGGIFTFGDARFLGSTGGLHLHQPVLRMIVSG
jgi:VCBS repeat-containing protein